MPVSEDPLRRHFPNTGLRVFAKRAPFGLKRFSIDGRGRPVFEPDPAAGGLAKTIPLRRKLAQMGMSLTWHAIGEGPDLEAQAWDQEQRRLGNAREAIIPYWLRFMDLGEHKEPFLDFVNGVFWNLQHDLLQAALEQQQELGDDRMFEGYIGGSEIIADNVDENALDGENQLLNDSHMAVVAGKVRERHPERVYLPMGLFLHTPMRSVDNFIKVLGRERTEVILRGMDAAHAVIFQRPRDQIMYEAARSQILGISAERGHRIAQTAARHVEGDGEEVRRLAGELATDQFSLEPLEVRLFELERKEFVKAEKAGRKKRTSNPQIKRVVGAFRSDEAKGIVEAAMGIRILLQDHPELAPFLEFELQCLDSRGNSRYSQAITKLVNALNDDFAFVTGPDRKLITLTFENNRGKALGTAVWSDVTIGPSRIEGHQLQAKEYAYVAVDAAILLGKEAGIAETFGDHCVAVDGTDPQSFANGLHTALHMSRDTKIGHLKAFREITKDEAPERWLPAIAGITGRAYDEQTTMAEGFVISMWADLG